MNIFSWVTILLAILVISSFAYPPSLTLKYACSLRQESSSFSAFRSGSSPLTCISKVLTPQTIALLKSDAAALQVAGFGGAAGVVNKRANNIRQNVHQVWITSPGCRQPMPLIGNLDQRKQLLRFVSELRVQLEGPRILPEELVELSYLVYHPGSYYERHVDTIADKHNRRCFSRQVSVILYLGDHKDDRRWSCDEDGGALRIHGREFASLTGYPVHLDEQGEFFSDIPPEPGLMVLFDSSKVPHEAIRSNRGRVCVVGWFGSKHDRTI